MLYKSKPHMIQAIRLEFPLPDPPPWLVDAYNRGNIMSVSNPKDKYVLIINNDGHRKAFPGDWICINAQGIIYPLTHEEFIDSFAPCK